MEFGELGRSPAVMSSLCIFCGHASTCRLCKTTERNVKLHPTAYGILMNCDIDDALNRTVSDIETKIKMRFDIELRYIAEFTVGTKMGETRRDVLIELIRGSNENFISLRDFVRNLNWKCETYMYPLDFVDFVKKNID